MDVRLHLERALRDQYAVERELGAGGMSLVYLATEKALGRQVVLKVLRQELSNSLSAERFRREIQLVAGLHHPHIVPVLNAGEADGVLYFTMPYVEGESLRHALRRSGELPVAQIIEILRDVCGALAYAHRQGVVHRDIKPENILLSSGGAVVTDFGIAKALVASRTGDGSLTTLTEVGTPLGTPAYMAPEQSAGDPTVDHRADIYSLGVVAYELLAGRPPFQERTPQALMAAHALQDPEDISTLRPATVPPLAELIRNCLEKHPADRPQTADEVLAILEAVARTPPGQYREARRARRQKGYGRRRLNLNRGFLFVGALVVTAGVIGAATTVAARSSPGPASRRFDLVLPDTAPLIFVGAARLGIGRKAIALSRDGTTLAYVAGAGQSSALYLRDLTTGSEHVVEGSDGAYQPFFSPDGRWVAYFSGTELKKANVTGGGSVSLVRIDEESSAAWGDDGRIYLVGVQGPLAWIPEAGGTPETIAFDPLGLGPLSSPQYLRGGWLLAARHHARLISLIELRTGREFLLTVRGLMPAASATSAQVFGSAASDLIRGAAPQYVSSGHIVFRLTGHDGSLQALPFDVDRQRVTGGLASVLRGVRHEGAHAAAQWSASDDGTLAYAPGDNAALARLVWRDRRGTVDTLPLPRGEFGQVRLSPNGQSLLFIAWAAGGGLEYWLADLGRGTAEKVIGIPDGAAINAWWSDSRTMLLNVGYDDPASGATVSWSADQGIMDTVVKGSHSWEVSPDTQWVTTYQQDGSRHFRHIRDSVPPIPAGGFFYSFSPDSKWAAMTSRASGKSEVYIVPVPRLRPRRQISVGGGEEAIWSQRGDEIVYRSGQQWYSVAVSTHPELSYSAPALLFEGPYNNVPGWSHALSPDGQRHLLMLGSAQRTSNRINIITNWFTDLRRLAPAR